MLKSTRRQELFPKDRPLKTEEAFQERFEEQALPEGQSLTPQAEAPPPPPLPEAQQPKIGEPESQAPKTAAEFVGGSSSPEEIALKILTASRQGEGRFNHPESAAAFEEQIGRYFRTLNT